MNVTQQNLVIGIGNVYRGDDAVGCLIARALQKKNDSTVRVIEHDGEPVSLMDAWKGAKQVFLIDAISSGSPMGTVLRMDLVRQPLPNHLLQCSTHSFGLSEAVELARAMGTLPPGLIFYGIEGEAFEVGHQLSPAVQAACESVMTCILKDIQVGLTVSQKGGEKHA